MSTEAVKEIFDAVVNGRVEEAISHVKGAIKEKVSVDEILKKGLIAAMDLVGERFGEGELFIPQVLWSAKAMQASMDLLKPHLAGSGGMRSRRVVIGTAEGDIHDIGKNLVAMMLEGAGFEVVDLGTDITPARFVQAVTEHRPQIVGLSALLTTTMPNMVATLEALKAAGLRDRVKVMIGGAPVTESFARSIGADGYSPDAASAVRLARSLAGA